MSTRPCRELRGSASAATVERPVGIRACQLHGHAPFMGDHTQLTAEVQRGRDHEGAGVGFGHGWAGSRRDAPACPTAGSSSTGRVATLPGAPMIMHPGTPETRVMGMWGHDAAVAAGVRLFALNRPGYGGSTSSTEPSLLATGRDTAAMAASLGLDEYAVFGLSGGGPFAVATAVADPGRVRALGVVGGIGPWRLIDDDLVERSRGEQVPGASRCRGRHGRLGLHEPGRRSSVSRLRPR